MNDTQILEHLGNNIRTLREQKGMSLETLAVKAELSPERLKTIEEGKWNDLDMLTMLRISAALEVTMPDLHKGV